MLLSTILRVCMTNVETLVDIIADPILGPYEGEDFWVDDDGTIQIAENNIVLAATIMRKANNSGEFTSRLVKVGHRGDSILLGFDTLVDAEPLYKATIGYQKSISAEVKKDSNGKFCLYLNKKRCSRLFSKMASVKTYLKNLDKELQSQPSETADIDD